MKEFFPNPLDYVSGDEKGDSDDKEGEGKEGEGDQEEGREGGRGGRRFRGRGGSSRFNGRFYRRSKL